MSIRGSYCIALAVVLSLVSARPAASQGAEGLILPSTSAYTPVFHGPNVGSPYTPAPVETPSATRWVDYAALGAIQMLDAHSTRTFLKYDIKEANPVMKGCVQSAACLYTTKALVAVAVAAIIEKGVAHKKPTWARRAVWTFVQGVGMAVTINYVQAMEKRGQMERLAARGAR